MKIYLAGGMRSGWQGKVKEFAPQHDYFDPSQDADQRFAYRWTQQEIEAVRNCDIVFAYFEKTNPSGLGLATEIGWATILDKPVIYIDEHDRINAFLCACSSRVYAKLEPAIEYIRGLK